MTFSLAKIALGSLVCISFTGCGGSETRNPAERVASVSSAVVSGPACADGSVEQVYASGLVGCSGKVSWDNRRNLCGAGYRPATAGEWYVYGSGAFSGGYPPEHNYWTDDDLRYTGPENGCWVSQSVGTRCSSGTPMRVCTASGSDAEGNACNWKNCGYNNVSPRYFGGCEGNETAGTLCIPEGCADGSIEQRLPNGMVGCAGAVTWADRDSLCAPGYKTVTAEQWRTLSTGNQVAPTHNYWTADDLKYNGSWNSCFVSTVSGAACAPGQPMRLCTATGTDPEGNTCNWFNCGLDAVGPNLNFGGCNGNTTAGTVCVPQRGCADGSVEQVLPNGFVGCAGTVSWSDRDVLCAPGYRTATAEQWRTLNQTYGPITPAHNYWTADSLKYSGSGSNNCSVSTTAGFDCNAGQPMRLCTPSGTDASGNSCNWTKCGLDTASPNLHFGGCNGNIMAGSLCVPSDVLAADITHQDPHIGEVLANARNRFPETPAIAAAVVVDNKIYLATLGKRKYDDASLTLQPNDKFQLDSISKAIAGVVLTRAVDQGTLAWNTTLGSTHPSIFQGGPPFSFVAYRDATLAEFNAHASGVHYNTSANSLQLTPDAANDYVNFPVIDRKFYYTRDAVLDEPLFPHGTGFRYGGGAITAISMLERKLGKTYDQILREWLFHPLGLKDSGSVPDVWQHRWHGGTSLTPYPPQVQTDQLRLPAAGVAMSIEDLSRFLHAALYSPRAPWHFWSHATQQTLLNNEGRSAYSAAGFGIAVSNDAGGVELSHNGCNLLNRSGIVIWPMRRIALAALTNYSDENCNAYAVWWVLQQLKEQLGPIFGAWSPGFPYRDAPTYQVTTASASSTWSSHYDAAKAFDGDYSTLWATAGNVTSATLEVQLAAPASVGHVVISEAGPINTTIPDVSAFNITAYQLFLRNGATEWLAASGTTLGVNKLIPVNGYGGVTGARLVVTGTDPMITEMHLLRW